MMGVTSLLCHSVPKTFLFLVMLSGCNALQPSTEGNPASSPPSSSSAVADASSEASSSLPRDAEAPDAATLSCPVTSEDFNRPCVDNDLDCYKYWSPPEDPDCELAAEVTCFLGQWESSDDYWPVDDDPDCYALPDHPVTDIEAGTPPPSDAGDASVLLDATSDPNVLTDSGP
jgi:hypothetical protein